MTKPKPPFASPEVAAVFDGYPPRHRSNMVALRNFIFEVAESIEGAAPLEEALKWGEPAYLPSKPRTGSTIRIDWKEAAPSQYSMFFNCKTDLVKRFRNMFPNDFSFVDNRCLSFNCEGPMPVQQLAMCIGSALTYHRDKKFKLK